MSAFATCRRTAASLIVMSVTVIAETSPLTGVASAADGLPLCRPWTESACVLVMAGSLKSASSGDPLPGRVLRFFVRDALACSAITGTDGRASCETVVGDGSSGSAFQWRIVFEGDGAFDAAASDERSFFGSMEARAGH
jgi:hypothetical protein